MGRHSIPDPEDSAGEEQHEEPQTERFGHRWFPRAGLRTRLRRAPSYDAPQYEAQDYPEPGYRTEDFSDSDDVRPDPDEFTYDEPGDEPDDDEPEFERGDAAAGFDLLTPGSPPPPPIRPRSGPQHGGDWDGGEWTGSHRAVTTGRRGVSVGVIAALVTVVVVVGAVILWRFFGDALSNRSDVAAARCVNGELAVAVVADASVADQIQTLADNYNQSAAPVGDRCVKVGVKPADSDQVVNGFTGQWPAELGERPAMWIPASSVSEARLEASAGAKTVSDSRSLVTSPVLLAIRPQLKSALGQQNWASLPSMQTNPTRTGRLGAARLGIVAIGDAAVRRQRCVLPCGRGGGRGVRAGRRPAELGDGRGELIDRRSTEAGGQQGVDRDGRTAGCRRPRRRAGPCGRHHRATAVPEGRRAAGREERRVLVDAAGADRGRRLSDGPAVRRLAVAGTGGGGQRVRAVHAQAGTTGRAGQGRLPHRRRHPAAERRHQLRAAVGPVVRGRHRDARDVGQHVDGACRESRGDHHAGPVDAGRRGR